MSSSIKSSNALSATVGGASLLPIKSRSQTAWRSLKRPRRRRASSYWALASGSLARALTLRSENVASLRDDALRGLGAANSGDPSRILAAAGEAASWSNREKMRRTLEFQFLLLRDLLRLKHGAPSNSLVNRDRLADLQKVAGGIEVREIRRRAALLEEVARAIDSNITPELAFFSAYARWGRSLAPDTAERAEAWPGWGRVRLDV